MGMKGKKRCVTGEAAAVKRGRGGQGDGSDAQTKRIGRTLNTRGTRRKAQDGMGRGGGRASVTKGGVAQGAAARAQYGKE